MPEERKLVTVLFADVVGSTEMGQSHDPEVVRAALGQAFTVARDVLETHGGTVEKFIGDAVMAVFGVPASHDDDPDRAVRAAFSLRDRVSVIDPGGGPALQVRIGVNTGEAVSGSGKDAQFLVTGPAVNAAARLQQAAAAGEILAGDLTKRLTAGGVRYGAAREVDAKGMGRIAAWSAEALTSAVPEQHRGLPGLRAPLIGRERELTLLIDAHASLAGRDHAQLVTIYGAAGSGKSRLASEFIDTVGRARVRAGRCLPYGEGITYYPIQLVLRADAGIQLADDRETAMSKLRAAVLQAFEGEAEDAEPISRRLSVLGGFERAEDVLRDVASEELREELAWGLRRYLERRAASSPLMLVFEDVHWAEPGLLDLIEQLAEWSRAPLLLLCLARPDFRELRPTWGSAIANVTSITLAPLTAEHTRRLITELLAIDDLPEALRSEIVTRAEGNPLYVEEFLRMLMETGRIERRADRWVASSSIATVEVPPTLQGLITSRLDRVGPEVKLLLQRASLAGRLFSTDALAALADGAKPDPELLRDAIRRDLLVEADEGALGGGRVFRFKHVLIRDVAYSTVPKAERSRLHDRYGRWLEQTLGDRRHEIADIVAFHAEQAFLFARELRAPETQDLSRRALDLLLEAGASALDRVDDRAALGLYERAAVIASGVKPTAAETAEIEGYRVLLRSQLAEGARFEEIGPAIAAASAVGPSRVLVELLLQRGVHESQSGSSDAAGRTIEEALAVARALNDPQIVSDVMWSKAFHAYWVGGIDEMHRLLIETLEFSRRTGAVRRIGRVLAWLGTSARYRGDFTGGRRYIEEGIASIPPGSKFLRAIVHVIRGSFAATLREDDTALDEMRQAMAQMRELGHPGWVANSAWHLGVAQLNTGDLEGARRSFSEAVEIFERRKQRGQIPEVRARLARVLIQLGQVSEARVHASIAREVALPNDHESRYIAAVAMGEVLEAEGDNPAAGAMFQEAVSVLEPTKFGDVLATAREHRASFLLRHGRGEEARALLEQVREFYRDPLAERHRERIDALIKQGTPLRT